MPVQDITPSGRASLRDARHAPASCLRVLMPIPTVQPVAEVLVSHAKAQRRKERTMGFFAPLRLCVILVPLLTASCIPKIQPVVLESERPVVVAMVFDQEDSPEVLGAPDAFKDQLVDLLSSRNLKPLLVPTDEFASAFEKRRATGQRMQWLSDGARSGELLLLVETRASFYSQISGQWRWTVSVKATLGEAGEDYPLDETMEVPVFLRFGNEAETEAIDEAVGVVKRRLGRLLDVGLAVDDDGSSDAGAARPFEPGRWGPVYFAMVDRFHNGDPGNDSDADPSDPQAFHGGDLRGVIDKVAYLHDLGFRTVWLSPVFAMRTERHGPWGAFHGYWLADPYTIEPRFGTEADLRELADALHARDMRLVLDFVANHVGSDTPVTMEHPDWLHGNGDVIDWHDPVQAETHDVHGLPDLAHENPEVQAWLLGAAMKWIELGVDGYRLDAVRHVPTDFWASFNDSLRAAAGDDFLLIGELFDGDPVAVSETMRAGRFGQMFDFPLHYAATDVICRDAHPGRLAAVLALDRLYDDPSRLATFADNHDLPRIASSCQGVEAGVLRLLVELRGELVMTWGTEWWLEGAEEPANRADARWHEPIAITAETTTKLLAPVVGVASLDESQLTLATESGDWLRVERMTVGGGQLNFVPPAGPLPSTAPGAVTFTVTGAPGADVVLVGAGPELGNWDPDRGLPLTPTTTITLPGATVIEYKLVLRTVEGPRWESRPNRYTLIQGGETIDLPLTWES